MPDEIEPIVNEEILPNLPARLRLMRLGLGWNQEDLAHHSGVGVKSISSFENGSRIYSLKVDQLIKLATACGYDLCQLLTDPLESFGISAAVLQSIVERVPRRQKRKERPFKPVDQPKKKSATPSNVKRGITIFRSSDHLVSPLGDGWR